MENKTVIGTTGETKLKGLGYAYKDLYKTKIME